MVGNTDLRQTFFGYVEVGEYLDLIDKRRVTLLLDDVTFRQSAVDSQAYAATILVTLDMYVAGAVAKRLADERV